MILTTCIYINLQHTCCMYVLVPLCTTLHSGLVFLVWCVYRTIFSHLSWEDNSHRQLPGSLTSPRIRPRPAAWTLWAPPPAIGPTVNWNGLPENTNINFVI